MNYIFAIIAYLLILVLVGFYKARSVKNSDDFKESIFNKSFFEKEKLIIIQRI